MLSPMISTRFCCAGFGTVCLAGGLARGVTGACGGGVVFFLCGLADAVFMLEDSAATGVEGVVAADDDCRYII